MSSCCQWSSSYWTGSVFLEPAWLLFPFIPAFPKGLNQWTMEPKLLLEAVGGGCNQPQVKHSFLG